MKLKLHFSKRFNSTDDMIARIDQLKQDWNKTFKSVGYSKMKKKLRILTETDEKHNKIS